MAATRGYVSRVQVIQRGGTNRQYYLSCPTPLAQALELEKGEEIEWVVEDKPPIVIQRPGSANQRHTWRQGCTTGRTRARGKRRASRRSTGSNGCCARWTWR